MSAQQKLHEWSLSWMKTTKAIVKDSLFLTVISLIFPNSLTNFHSAIWTQEMLPETIKHILQLHHSQLFAFHTVEECLMTFKWLRSEYLSHVWKQMLKNWWQISYPCGRILCVWHRMRTNQMISTHPWNILIPWNTYFQREIPMIRICFSSLMG